MVDVVDKLELDEDLAVGRSRQREDRLAAIVRR